jgi:ribosomal protein RSM22 (predicted rRNA methylase)
MVAVKKSITYPFEEKFKELRSEFRHLKNDFRTFVDQALEHSVANNVVKVLQEIRRTGR